MTILNTGSHTYDSIVIGAGVMGSATAYHLAQDGRRVLLLEQFNIDHAHGSSHGGSRVIRTVHDTLDYTRVMPATYELWRRLEQESGEQLLQITGGLYLGAGSAPFLLGAQAVLKQFDYPYRLLSSAELREQYPQFRLPDEWTGLYEDQAGILAASRCVKALIGQAVRHGVVLREQTRVCTVRPIGDGVAVDIAGAGCEETVYAQQAIITTGPWAQRLLAPLLSYSLPLTVTHQQVAFFAVERPELHALGRCPLYLSTSDLHFYGFPIFELPGHVKVGLELTGKAVDPDGLRDTDQTALQTLCETVTQTLVGVKPVPAHVELCLYTETPGRDFIIDRHPEHPQILIGVGFSGRGFKFAINIGRLLADLAQSAPSVYDSEFWLPRYAVGRFAPVIEMR